MAPYLILCLLILLILYHGSKKVPQKKDKFEYYLISTFNVYYLVYKKLLFLDMAIQQ